MRIQRAVFAVLLLLPLRLAADQVHPSLLFRSTHQSIWGKGAAAPPSKTRFTVINPSSVSWNVATPGYSNYYGGFWSADTYLFGEADFGAGVRARSSGHAGLWLDLNVDDPGSVDVQYPVTPTVTFPDQNSFRAGDTVAIKTSYALDSGWQMTTTSPQFDLSLKGTFALNAEASARLCVFDCVNFPVVPQFGFDTGEFTVFSVKPGDKLETPPWLGEFTPWSGSIGVPNIQTTASLHTNNRTLLGTGSDEFMSLALDLTAVASSVAEYAGIPVPPLSYDTASYPGFDDFTGIHLHYEIVTVSAVARLSARQSFRFDPDLKVSLRFAKPLEHWVVSGGSIGPTETSTSVEMKVGDTLYVKYPETDKQPTSVDPTFKLNNQFESSTGLGVAETIETSAGQFGVTIPRVEIFPELCFPAIEAFGIEITPEFCTPSVNTPSANVAVGPLFENTLPIASQDLGTFFSGSWTLEGFSPVTINAFALDPENPIVNIDQQTGLTRNLGAGRRQVAYAIDFSNGGDVLLSNVHLVADLAAAFSAANTFKVDQIIGCAVATNPEFDGAAKKELLAPDTKLDVGARARVILIVSVYPKPDPPAYVMTSTTDGTSPLGTLVTKSDSSDVTLGPGVITSADDFVLYADQWVKLEAIADSFGHIGANDFVEVKNGNSGIVAGDLRAGRVIKVQGSITADYAFAGGVVDVVKPGQLTLSGNAKPFSTMKTFTRGAPVFTPSSAFLGNVWVEANGTRTLQPGYYGDVTVNNGATLSLAPGQYFFLSLSVLDSANIDLLRGGEVNVRGRASFGTNARVAAGGAVSSRDAMLNFSDPGEIRISQGSMIRGIVNAPRANVTFEERSRLEGSVYAKSITLRPGASASFHRDCDRLIDRDCNGLPDCLR